MKSIVHIPKPCAEDWSKMNPTQKGGFCNKCQYEVHDYTTSSMDEIQSELQNPANKCIRIQQYKLDELNFFEWFDHLTLSSRNKYLLLFALLFLGAKVKGQDTTEMVEIDSTDLPDLSKLTTSEDHLDTIYEETIIADIFLIPKEHLVTVAWPLDLSYPIILGFVGPFEPPPEQPMLQTNPEDIGRSKTKKTTDVELKDNPQPKKNNEPKERNPFNIPYTAVMFRRNFYEK